MLAELTVKEFLDKVAGSDPVPGGGSVAALNGAVASALTAMVAGLTIGKKGYEEHEELMKHISRLSIRQQEVFVEYIDRIPRHTTMFSVVSSYPNLQMKKRPLVVLLSRRPLVLRPSFRCRWRAMPVS